MDKLDNVVVVGDFAKYGKQIDDVASECHGFMLYKTRAEDITLPEARRELYDCITDADYLIVVGDPGIDTLFEIELALRCGCKIIYLDKSYEK